MVKNAFKLQLCPRVRLPSEKCGTLGLCEPWQLGAWRVLKRRSAALYERCVWKQTVHNYVTVTAQLQMKDVGAFRVAECTAAAESLLL